MVIKKAVGKKAPAKASAASTQKVVEDRIGKSIREAAQKEGLTVAAQQSANVDYYLLIDFGFTTSTFQPNSVQFYSNTLGFLCSKLIDNASLVSLVPILNCKTVRVTWDTTTQQALHVYGMQTKP
ncbi:MAG TPA: hypothetical protein VNW71_04010 [Thermoanaerobaculia bacterium]|nr:hypothetical protein [Thermoanaerobaculia bacterium]